VPDSTGPEKLEVVPGVPVCPPSWWCALQVDRLFDHMVKGVMDASQAQSDDSESVQILDRAQSNEGEGHLGERNLGHFTPVLEPVVVRPDASDASIARVVKTKMLS
jgi:hypothetical protein